MAYIIKNTAGLINTMLTDAARKRISQGKFDISYFQVGDSEVCYDCIDNIDPTSLNVLMPQFNAQNTTQIPEKNRMHVKYPLFVDSTSGSTYGIPIESSFVDNIFNTAQPRGFFTGNTNNYSAFTTSAITINPNFIVPNSAFTSGNTIVIERNNLNPIVSGTVTSGMVMNVFTTTNIDPYTANTPMFTYFVVGVTGDTSSASTITIQVDRNLPDFNTLGFTGNGRVLFYPPNMTSLYDTFTPEPYWATNVFNFESNCDISQADVKVWNMNIPWTESPAGLIYNTYQDYNYFGSTGYCGSKEYFGYTTNDGQNDTSSVYFYNSFDEIVEVEPKDQKAIAIVHYTNQSIDNFYGEKFALQEFDSVDPYETGQARNLKISIPWLMWHKNPTGSIGEEFFVDPSGFTSIDLFQVQYIKSNKTSSFNDPGLRYYHLWDTHANSDGYPSRVGKVFPDLKMVVFDDDEIVASLNYKTNRSWTLPAPKLALITPNTFGGVLGGTTGLLTGSTDTLFLTYRFNNSAFTNSLHCNYYSTIKNFTNECAPDGTLVAGSSDVIVRFGNEFPFLISDIGATPSGFTANNMKILAQRVASGTTRPDPTLWKEIDMFSQLSATSVNGYLTVTGLTGTTLQITKNMYDTASYYQLGNYITLPQLNESGTTFNFGDEYYFYGTIKTDIQATIYVMNYLCNLGQTQFQDSSNPTWNNTVPPYVTEVALYNSDKELMVISKIQSPEKRQGIQQYPIKLDF